VVEKLAYGDGYLAFWSRYLAADQSFCDADGCLVLPTWNHLWFVAYLLVYTLLLAALLAVAKKPLLRFGEMFADRLKGVHLLIWPILFLAAARHFLLPLFEVTHALIDDWYNHAVSFTAFLFGFLVMKERSIAAECIRLRWPALAIALAAYCGYASYVWAYRADGAVPPDALRTAMRLVFAVDQWAAVVAILGFGARHLTLDSRLLRTLTEAVFPFYIVHQTIIVAAGHHLKPLGLSALPEAALLLAITIAGCWLTYDITRRVAPLRPLFGLGPRKAAARSHPALDRVPGPD
jgi:surface polysaccharide O-acyltransferase-like enzyme